MSVAGTVWRSSLRICAHSCAHMLTGWPPTDWNARRCARIVSAGSASRAGRRLGVRSPALQEVVAIRGVEGPGADASGPSSYRHRAGRHRTEPSASPGAACTCSADAGRAPWTGWPQDMADPEQRGEPPPDSGGVRPGRAAGRTSWRSRSARARESMTTTSVRLTRRRGEARPGMPRESAGSPAARFRSSAAPAPRRSRAARGAARTARSRAPTG